MAKADIVKLVPHSEPTSDECEREAGFLEDLAKRVRAGEVDCLAYATVNVDHTTTTHWQILRGRGDGQMVLTGAVSYLKHTMLADWYALPTKPYQPKE